MMTIAKNSKCTCLRGGKPDEWHARGCPYLVEVPAGGYTLEEERTGVRYNAAADRLEPVVGTVLKCIRCGKPKDAPGAEMCSSCLSGSDAAVAAFEEVLHGAVARPAQPTDPRLRRSLEGAGMPENGQTQTRWPIMADVKCAHVFTAREHTDANGGIHILVSAPEPVGYACASVFKGRTIGPDRASIVWEPARVNFPAYGGRPVALVTLHLSAITYALSLAAQLDVQFPVGSRADEEG